MSNCCSLPTVKALVTVFGITLTLGPRYRGLSRDRCGQKCSCGGHKSSCGVKLFVTRSLAPVFGSCGIVFNVVTDLFG
jgi:hypothetical protein